MTPVQGKSFRKIREPFAQLFLAKPKGVTKRIVFKMASRFDFEN